MLLDVVRFLKGCIKVHLIMYLGLALGFFISTQALGAPSNTKTETPAAARLPDHLTFTHLLKNNDNLLGEMLAIFQDASGFIWLGGSNMVARYDGDELKIINDTQDNAAIKNTTSFFEANGDIWIGTRTGLYRYNIQTEKARRVPDSNTAVPLSHSPIMEMGVLQQGQVVAASDSGLFLFEKDGSYKLFRAEPGNNNALQSARVRTLLVEEGRVVLGTDLGLEIFDINTQQFRLIPLNKNEANNVKENAVNAILPALPNEPKGYWLGTINGFVFLPQSGHLTRYQSDLNNAQSLAANDIWKLARSQDGNIWIGTDGGGISVFNPGTQLFKNYANNPYRPSSLSSNSVRSILQDNAGDMWVGTYPEGLHYFNRASTQLLSYQQEPNNPNSLPHSSVLSVVEAEDNILWLGTDGGGLTRFDRNTGQFKHFKNNEADPTSIPSNAVLTVSKDSRGTIWGGTWAGGIFSIDPKTFKVTRYPFKEGITNAQSTTQADYLNSGAVWDVREDTNGYLWVSTHSGGLNRLDRTTQTFVHYTPSNTTGDAIYSHLIWTTLEDTQGNFWVGTSASLDLFDQKTGKFTHYQSSPDDENTLSNGSVLSLYESKGGDLWIGTDFGLNRMDIATKKITRFNHIEAIFGATIRNIEEDEQGHIWLSTNNGIAILNPATQEVKTITRNSGKLLGGFNSNSGMVSSNNEIIFGGNSGLRIFNPSEISENTTPPKIAFTDFTIASESVVPSSEGVLKSVINRTQAMTLTHKDNVIEFAFVALNYRDSEKNLYSYKLEGFDENWSKPSALKRAKYTNLPAGNFTFLVKAANNDGIWNEQARAITIIQLPPPWLSWWAFMVYGLIVVAIIAGFIVWQRNKRLAIEKQNILLEQKVSERTAVVHQQTKDIREMLTTMPIGLFTINEAGLVNPQYSQSLEKLLNTSFIKGRNAIELIFENTHLGADERDAMVVSLSCMMGEDCFNYECNKEHLITEFSRMVNNQEKIFAIEWTAIIDDNDCVEKMMVSLRDITALRIAENKGKAQQQQLEIISQLLNISANKFLAFEKSAINFIAENKNAIAQVKNNTASKNTNDSDNTSSTADIVALLFRNMHTIKGNCRTYGFTVLSDTVHEIETVYSELRASHTNTAWDAEFLLADLARAEQVLALYSDAFRHVLGRDSEPRADRRGGVWLPDNDLDHFMRLVARGDTRLLEKELIAIRTGTLEETLTDVLQSLDSIAQQLNKPAPKVMVQTPGLRINKDNQEFIVDIFAHLLRNSLDHGIELPSERLALGKPEVGKITIRGLAVGDQYQIWLKDDGAGININKLRTKAQDKNLFENPSEITPMDIAETLFLSGVSTKDEVSNISGRGVGMDAVRGFLRQRGGDIAIIINELGNITEYASAEFLITLPADGFINTLPLTPPINDERGSYNSKITHSA